MANHNTGLLGAFREIGIGLNDIFKSVEATFALYFIGFVFLMYILYYTALSKSNQFQGRAAKSISIILSIFTGISIFYYLGWVSPGAAGAGTKSVVEFFSGWLSVIVSMIVGGGIIAYGFSLKKKAKNTNWGNLWFTLSLALGMGIIYHVFNTSFPTAIACLLPNTCSSLNVSSSATLGFIKGIFYNVYFYSWWATILLLLIIAFNAPFQISSGIKEASKNSEAKEKTDIDEVREALADITRSINLLEKNHADYETNLRAFEAVN